MTAFEDVARSLAPGLTRRARLLTRDEATAQDLVQETLTRLYVHWARIDPDGGVSGYAHRTLFRLFLKGRHRETRELPSADLPERSFDDSQIADAVALRRALSRALAVLSPLERAVVVLRYLDDLSVDDAARTLDRSPGAIRVSAHRALAKLRLQPSLTCLLSEEEPSRD